MDIQGECIRRIAAVKDIAADSMVPATTLESLGVDSLDRVSLAFDLEEEYGVELPESDLHRLVTVGDVAAAIERALQNKPQPGTAS